MIILTLTQNLPYLLDLSESQFFTFLQTYFLEIIASRAVFPEQSRNSHSHVLFHLGVLPADHVHQEVVYFFPEGSGAEIKQPQGEVLSHPICNLLGVLEHFLGQERREAGGVGLVEGEDLGEGRPKAVDLGAGFCIFLQFGVAVPHLHEAVNPVFDVFLSFCLIVQSLLDGGVEKQRIAD